MRDEPFGIVRLAASPTVMVYLHGAWSYFVPPWITGERYCGTAFMKDAPWRR